MTELLLENPNTVPGADAWREASRLTETYEATLRTAAAQVYPERASEDPLDVFPEPTTPRAAAPNPGLSAEQEADLRAGAGVFGIGGEITVKSKADYSYIEGGKPWKILAESKNTDGKKIYGGSDRPLDDEERTYMRGKLEEARGGESVQDDEVARTEYDAARQLAELEPGFTPLAEDDVLPYGYDISNNFAFVEEPTGQLKQIGTDALGEPVYILRVDREHYQDAGVPKYRNQPNGTDLMLFLSKVLEARGDTASSIGIETSNTYASRALDAVRAGLVNGREFTCGMYSRQDLADAKGEDVASPTAINQIPGELNTVAQKLALLRAAVLEHRARYQDPFEQSLDLDPLGGDALARAKRAELLVGGMALAILGVQPRESVWTGSFAPQQVEVPALASRGLQAILDQFRLPEVRAARQQREIDDQRDYGND